VDGEIIMTDDHLSRIAHYRGSPQQIGFAIGRRLGGRLENNIRHYINRRRPAIDMDRLQRGALPWLQGLPSRFQDEFAGMAAGANLPVQLLAEWAYLEECELSQCSGLICLIEQHAWVARNNDTYVPEMWGYVTIREVDERIPTICFSLEGDVFTPTGINQEKLWLHYNYLPVPDQPRLGKPHLPGYAFLVEALECCRTLDDVERLLGEMDRDGGMLLFVVDGKNDEFALFECTCSQHYRRNPRDGWVVGTNHYCLIQDPDLLNEDPPSNTLSRYRRMENLLRSRIASPAAWRLPGDLIHMLADGEIERRREAELCTAYANVACPASGAIWYTFGGYPAASQGNWQILEWPWKEEHR
jgi:hypothetical protein